MFIVAMLGMSVPAIIAAEDAKALPAQTSDTKQLLRIIEEQQRRLDAQDAQLEQQRKALQELRREVEALQDKSETAAPTGITDKTEKPPQAKKKEKSFKTAGAAQTEEWPGFFRVPGTDTQFKISGFAELDVIHDTNNVETPTAFVTQAIQTRGSGKNDGQTSFSVQATRLALETRTPLEGSTPADPRRVTTFISADFFNDLGSSTPDLRLREAYGEVSDFLHSGGELLLGQTWSAYTNLYAIPSTLEFWAPNAIFGARNPAVRWTMPVGDGLKLKLAAEAPNLRNFEVDNSFQIENAENRPRWPDGVVALEWERDSFHLTGGFIARDLRARTDDGHVESAFGWATTLGGRLGMPEILKDDFLQFQLTYGEGIGSLFNDFPPDAVYDVADDDLKPLETLGLLFGYQHWWSPKFYSLGTWGWLWQDNRDVQLPTAYHETMYTSLNLTWVPDPRWLLGGEVVYGRREDKDGESGSNVRTVVTSRFNF
jgi:hypothetical protein